MDRDVTNRGPAICLIWVSRIFKLSFVSRNSSIYFMWFLVVIKNRQSLVGQLHIVSSTQIIVEALFIMHTLVLLICILLICTTLRAQMIVGAVPLNLNQGTVVVLSQRQQRLDRISIRRRIVTHDRLDRQREQSLRQQQARDRNQEQRRSLRAALTTEQVEFHRDGVREARAALTPESAATRS